MLSGVGKGRIGYAALKHADKTVNYLEERTQDFFREQNYRKKRQVLYRTDTKSARKI